MAQAIVQEVYFRLNPDKTVDIISGDQILETVELSQAASRLSFHRAELAKASGVTFVEARPRNRGARA